MPCTSFWPASGSEGCRPFSSLVRRHREAITRGSGSVQLQTLKRFSAMALPVMLAVIATGIIVTDRMVDTSYAALVATSYGWLLDAKLALLAVVLVIAARARPIWLPSLAQNEDVAAAGGRGLRKWVTFEFVLALGIVLVATIVANTVPAKHAVIENWPYPFRFSIDATWGELSVMIRAGVGVALLLLAGGVVALGRTKRWETKWRIAIPAALAVGALAVALPPLALRLIRKPTARRRSRSIPFPLPTARPCSPRTACPAMAPKPRAMASLAKTFAMPPVDLLTEPHTAKHTAGDFFHWLTYGIPGTGMPAFADKLSEEDRWDVVNFLHAMSRGYQARLINPYVAPNQPYMAPQNFSYSAHDGTSGTLKDFRRQKAVLLVLFSWPESRARLAQLRLGLCHPTRQQYSGARGAGE